MQLAEQRRLSSQKHMADLYKSAVKELEVGEYSKITIADLDLRLPKPDLAAIKEQTPGAEESPDIKAKQMSFRHRKEQSNQNVTEIPGFTLKLTQVNDLESDIDSEPKQ
jgi:hypothetical protein